MAFTESSPVKPNDYLNRLELDGEDGSEFIDHWDTGELLFLASSVLRSDRNWVSVARSIKPFGEQTRPADWYTPKNCALQYTKLLSEIDEDSKKKTLPRTERETSEVMLVKNLTDKRLTELAWLNQQTKATSNVLKTYLEMVESGDFDEHLDDLLKQIEDQDKTEEDNYSEYTGRRENLNTAKKLNKSRITKGKTVSKVIDPKKKFPDILDDASRQMAISELTIKKEVVIDDDFPKTVHIKTETEAPITLNALLDTKVTTASDSPLLTSLLRSIASTTAPSTLSVGIPLKEGDEMGELSRLEDLKSRDASPRSSVPPSPRTPSSSPMLNSLLKNSPSSTTAIQLSPSKDISPKAVSSPQPFFNPSSVLASAAAQQLAVATSSLPQFLQQDPSSESRKFGTSPNTSACLSAPTLSKLLEMPPSTPGRLPPLPVLDPPVATPALIPEPLSELTESPSNEPRSKPSSEPPFPDSSTLQKSSTSYSKAASGIHVLSELKPMDSKAAVFKFKGDLSRISQENIDLIEAVAESIEQVFDVKDIKQEVVEEESVQVSIPDILLEATTIPTEGVRPEDCIIDIQSLDSSTIDEVLSSMENANQESKIEAISSNSIAVKLLDPAEIDKSLSGRKFYKSRNPSKKEENVECSAIKEVSQIKVEPESPSTLSSSKNMTTLVVETSVETLQDSKPGRTSDSKSPVCKKPRLSERNSVERTELSEDENPATIRRSGRRGIKGQASKGSSPSKQLDPKDQYEFTESTEENSVGYQISNTLCYMPRSKEEDSKKESEEMTSNTSLPSEKKVTTPVRGKQGRPVSQATTARKSLFPTDEEKLSEISDESTLSEEKLKKWEEVCEKKKDVAKSASESLKRISKPVDSPKKKPLPLKRTVSGRRKEQKLSSTDMEDLSVGSRDSEDMSSQNKDTSEEKDPVPSTPVDMEMDTNDSQPSSSAAAESDKQLDDVEESSVSSPPPVPNKEEKETAQWFQGVSPKSSEAVSQSSEESEEYESDNWDNQSVSTNKSATHAASTQPRLTRKERESPQYKTWKKAISIVLREATCHKNANIFLQKVTNDVAPGYLSVVHKPMDLSLIKKNIDNGVIRTTEEFQRDMLLMFQNAIMYNSSDHDVYKMAVEMQRDVVAQISAFIGTQSSEKDEATEPVSSLRGGRKSLKGQAKHGAKADKEE